VAQAQPFDIMDDGRGAGFDTAVIAVDGFGATGPGIGESLGLRLGAEPVHIVAQRALIACQRQHAAGLLFDDRPRDVALAPHRIDRHDRAVDGHQIEQLRDDHAFVRFSATVT
jgi:hypothetical protein